MFQSDSPTATLALGRELAQRFAVGDCVALVGPLGAGKTILVRGIAEGLGVADSAIVASPTYVLVREYAGRVTIFHVDLYRIQSPRELDDLALEDILVDGVVLVEWADRAPEQLPERRWEIDIEMTGRRQRRLTVRRQG